MYPEGVEILIVDHDAARRRLAETILRNEGFPVTAVSEGLAALRAIARQDFALVIAAIALPGMLDGTTTMRRARMRRPRLKVLMIAEPTQPPRWRGRDGDDAVVAPFERWELLGCVFELLQRDTAFEAIDLARRCRSVAHA